MLSRHGARQALDTNSVFKQVVTLTFDIAWRIAHVNLPVSLDELTALKQLLGDRNLGSDEEQQVDGETEKLFILELVHLNQVRIRHFQALRYSNHI